MELTIIGGVLLGIVIGLLLGALVAAVFMKLSVRIAAGFSPTYLRALGVVLLAGLVVVVANVGLVLLLAGPGEALAASAGAGWARVGLLSLVALLANAACIRRFIRRPGDAAMAWGTALLVALVYLVVMAALGVLANLMLPGLALVPPAGAA